MNTLLQASMSGLDHPTGLGPVRAAEVDLPGLNPRFNARQEIPTLEEIAQQAHIDQIKPESL